MKKKSIMNLEKYKEALQRLVDRGILEESVNEDGEKKYKLTIEGKAFASGLITKSPKSLN